MRLTREAFAELFGVHLPAAVPCAWVKGVCFVFVDQVGRDRIKKALLDYCGQDTLAMVRLLERLRLVTA